MKTPHVKFTFLIVLLLFNVGCGKNTGSNKCQTREQVLIQCIAEGIKLRPNPAQLEFVEIDCQRMYPVEQCYLKRDRYFIYDY